jgi:hypothetical protein
MKFQVNPKASQLIIFVLHQKCAHRGVRCKKSITLKMLRIGLRYSLRKMILNLWRGKTGFIENYDILRWKQTFYLTMRIRELQRPIFLFFSTPNWMIGNLLFFSQLKLTPKMRLSANRKNSGVSWSVNFFLMFNLF